MRGWAIVQRLAVQTQESDSSGLQVINASSHIIPPVGCQDTHSRVCHKLEGWDIGAVWSEALEDGGQES